MSPMSPSNGRCGVEPTHTARARLSQDMRQCISAILRNTCTSESGMVAVSNVKRLFRSRFGLDLSETALGYSRVSELLQDHRLHDICALEARQRTPPLSCLRSSACSRAAFAFLGARLWLSGFAPLLFHRAMTSSAPDLSTIPSRQYLRHVVECKCVVSEQPGTTARSSVPSGVEGAYGVELVGPRRGTLHPLRPDDLGRAWGLHAASSRGSPVTERRGGDRLRTVRRRVARRAGLAARLRRSSADSRPIAE